MGRAAPALTAPSLLLFPRGAQAHMMGVVYNLPIPFWMYAFATSAALALSFVVVGYFVTAQGATRNFRTFDLGVPNAATRDVVLGVLRTLSVLALLLTIVTGLFGAPNPFTNFSVAFFWVTFVLGFTYLTALVGDVYALINPWRVICDFIERFRPGAFRGHLRYPGWLGYYPALMLYMALIWLELFGHPSPRILGEVLLAYSAINVVGAWLLGSDTWFCYGELFAVFLRIIAKIAPFEYIPGHSPAQRGRIRLRQPFIGLLKAPADHFSLLLFVLFMLSSTAFDAVHETLPWVQLFWKYLYPLLTHIFMRPYLFFVDIYYYWQWAMLLVSPLVYAVIYLCFVWLTKEVARSERSVRDLALQFTFSLVPIAFVYNITHYYTLLITEAPAMVSLISDPFGFGWNLFGTARLEHAPIILLADSVWHTQVGLILFGHIVAVYLAHTQALRLFAQGRRALWSQLPMLALMMLLTTIGLRILSLPIAAGQVQDPALTGSIELPPVARTAKVPFTPSLGGLG
ncbi:MAG TPA: hypothetical protein VG425_00275 [Casimicrobiaceae bacterium]|nr:hypothetical protein [Casimicrobiaceae bacterium]